MKRFHGASRRQRHRNRHTHLTLEPLERRAMVAATAFVEINLASDILGVAEHADKDLTNPSAFATTVPRMAKLNATDLAFGELDLRGLF
jgi:hypothetical protein